MHVFVCSCVCACMHTCLHTCVEFCDGIFSHSSTERLFVCRKYEYDLDILRKFKKGMSSHKAKTGLVSIFSMAGSSFARGTETKVSSQLHSTCQFYLKIQSAETLTS